MINYLQLSLAVVYDSVLFPFDINQLIKMLPSHGFVPTEDMPRIFPVGGRAEITGIVAGKGDIFIRIETPRRIVAVHASSIDSVVFEMESLEDLIRKVFDVDGPNMAKYYESVAAVTIKTDQNLLENWASYHEKLPLLKEASKIIGAEASLFGVRLAPVGQGPNQPNWFDIRIEPFVDMPTDYHSIQVIYRRSNRQEVMEFVKSLEKSLTALASLVEQG